MMNKLINNKAVNFTVSSAVFPASALVIDWSVAACLSWLWSLDCCLASHGVPIATSTLMGSLSSFPGILEMFELVGEIG